MADYNFITETGVIIPDTLSILLQVQNEYKAILGANLDVSPQTIQGAYINAETLQRVGVLANNAQLANQINPNLSGGVFLDAVLGITGGSRQASTFSTINNVVLSGVPNTPVPAGSQAGNSVNGSTWQLETAVNLGPTGSITATFQAVESGEITCDVGQLNQVVSGVLGWETVNNTEVATIGESTQTDEETRNYRKETLAVNAFSYSEAIFTAIRTTSGVNSLSFRENIKSTTETIDGVLMAPKSIYACVDGGVDEDVALALVDKKGGGPDFNGTVTVQITDPFSSQIFDVKFDRPDNVQIFARVTASVDSSLQDPADVIRNSIVEYADGLLSNEPGFVVGGDVSPFELAGAVNQREPSIFVSNCEISLDGLSYTQSTLSIEIFQKAIITQANIQVIFT